MKLVACMFLVGCGVDSLATSTVESPIIGGTTVTAGEFPTVVALEQSPGQWFCTGTLVGANWVLTAAHCVEGAPPTGVKIRFDGLDVTQGTQGEEVGTVAYTQNAGWDGEHWHDDIALVKLAAPTTHPYTPLHREPTAIGTAVTQVGYGVTGDNGQGGGILRKLAESNVDCALTGDPMISNDEVLCFDPADGGGCYGDSGGPTFVQVGDHLEVTGVTSGGTDPNGSCSASYGIWTHVAANLDFLDPIMATAPDPTPTDPDPVDPTPDPDPTDPTDPTDPASGGDGGGCAVGHASSGTASGVVLGAFVVAAIRRRRRRA